MEHYINQTLVILPGDEDIPSYYALEKKVALNFLITYYDRDPLSKLARKTFREGGDELLKNDKLIY